MRKFRDAQNTYMTNGLLIYGEKYAHFLTYIRNSEALPHI
jgi:hypothetical protein